MFEFLANLLLAIVWGALGLIALLAGRKYLWLLLGVAGLVVTAQVLAAFYGYANAWGLVTKLELVPILISVAFGVLAMALGRHNRDAAITFIGFAVGVFVASWFDQLIFFISGRAETDSAPWWLFLVFLAAGLLGVWIIRRGAEQELILVSVIIGVKTITDALNLPAESNITAVVILSLALVGIVVQYAALLREQPPELRVIQPVPHPVSEELPYS